jgi:pimeloyl-ACP methyl ester carboxylesterase
MAGVFSEFNFPVADFGKGGSSHSITCYSWGSPSASLPVLCVHGLTRNGRDFDYLARSLSASRYVLCPDMPGRGKSQYLDDPSGYAYPAYVADIATLLAAKNITRLDWVGTSMGGIIGMMFAATFPGVIRKLVLNDIGMTVSAEGLKRILAYADAKPKFALRAEGEAIMRERIASFGIRDEEHWQHMFAHGFRKNDDGTYSFAYDPRILSSLVAAATGPLEDIQLWAMWDALAALPILLIRGGDSDLLTHATAMDMKEKHPGLTLREIAGCGHAPALMEQEQVELVKEWLGNG